MGIIPLQSQDKSYMRLALIEAQKAQSQGEVPVGAIITQDNEVIATGYNQQITTNDPTAHAEIIALRSAGNYLQNYRLIGTTLYVTLEPCAMCLTALVHARVARVVYAASDPKTGSLGGCIDLSTSQCFNHQLAITSGVLAEEASTLLINFFKQRRKRKSQQISR